MPTKSWVVAAAERISFEFKARVDCREFQDS